MIVITNLEPILAANAGTRVNGCRGADRTATARAEALRAFFRMLVKRAGLKIEKPENIGTRHIEAAVKIWRDDELSAKTIQNYLSTLRIFCGWIGKPGLVKDIYYYLPDVPKAELRTKTVAEKSKSLAANGIEVIEKIELALSIDWRFGCMLMMQVAFGLRRIEAVRMKPWKVDFGNKISVTETKGGRPRDIYIESPVQREALDFVKSKVKGKNETLGWRERVDGKPFANSNVAEASLKYSENRYDYLIQKLGLTRQMANCTGHGLRAQFAENAALLKGFIPMTLGGTSGKMPRDELDVARLQVSELLGHSRLSVTGAYYGSFGRDTGSDAPGHAKEVIEVGLAAIPEEQLTRVSLDRSVTCATLSVELSTIDVYTDPRKIQYLWENHSRRNAVEWLATGVGSNLAALEAAAISVARSGRGSPDQVQA